MRELATTNVFYLPFQQRSNIVPVYFKLSDLSSVYVTLYCRHANYDSSWFDSPCPLGLYGFHCPEPDLCHHLLVWLNTGCYARV